MTSKPYHLVARILHWLIALLMFWAIALGLIAEDLPNSPEKIELFVLHKSAGFTVLVLAVVRLIWRFINPPSSLGLKPIQEKMAAAGHWGLYILMLAVPVSGWLLNSTAGYPFAWFNLIPISNIPGVNSESRAFFSSLHVYLFYVMALMVLGHIAMLIVHKQFDGINLLPRMLPGKITSRASALVFTLSVLLGFTIYKANQAGDDADDAVVASKPSQSSSAVEQVSMESGSPRWQLVSTPDNFLFTNSYAGQPFVGAIRQFEPVILFNPAEPGNGVIDVNIETQSITTNNKDWDATIKGSQWFSTKEFPNAHYLSRDIHSEDGKFVANGELTLKGITKPIQVTFEWQQDGANATFIGTAIIDRREFNIGSGSWATDDSVAFDVMLDINLRLERL